MSDPFNFKRENRYLVLKRKYLERAMKHFPESYALILDDICNRVNYLQGKPNGLTCVIVEQDWPEYETTWAAIEQRIKKEIDRD